MDRTRFAPSPTGSLHIGGARTALYNYLFAKNQQGKFLLRIEDTDKERHLEDSLKQQINDLNWLGISWDEGFMPDGSMQGDESSYRQSERIDIYQQCIKQLLDEGKAFYCFLHEDELEKMRQDAIDKKEPFRVVSPYRDLSINDAEQRAKQDTHYTIRLKNDFAKVFGFDDLVRGHVDLPSEMVGDFVLMRSGGMPVYNFACVVDDHFMAINYVLRGEEHLSNTVRQLMIYESLGWAPPQFAHLSVIIGKDRKKLSKRDNTVSVDDFKSHGYLPEALLNAMLLLGWSDPEGREILTLDEMVEAFDVKRLHVASAMFDIEKLNWLNAQYLRAMGADEIYVRLKSCQFDIANIQHWGNQVITDLIELYKHDAHTLQDLYERLMLVLGPFEIDDEGKKVLEWESSHSVFAKWLDFLKDKPDDIKSRFPEIINEIKIQCDVKGKKLFNAFICII